MALIKCEECGKEISEQASICPNCGAKTDIAKKQKENIITALIIAVLILIIGLFIFANRKDKFFNKYVTETVEILEEYRENKITSDFAVRELYSIKCEIEERAEKIKDESEKRYDDYTTLLINIGCVSREIEKNTIDETRIDEYIKYIKRNEIKRDEY